MTAPIGLQCSASLYIVLDAKSPASDCVDICWPDLSDMRGWMSKIEGRGSTTLDCLNLLNVQGRREPSSLFDSAGAFCDGRANVAACGCVHCWSTKHLKTLGFDFPLYKSSRLRKPANG